MVVLRVVPAAKCDGCGWGECARLAAVVGAAPVGDDLGRLQRAVPGVGDVMLVASHPRSASSAALGWLAGASHTSSIHQPDRVTPCESSRFSSFAPASVSCAIACELVMFVSFALGVTWSDARILQIS